METNPTRDLLQVFEDKENGLEFMKNVSIPLKDSSLPIRANICLPLPTHTRRRVPRIPYEAFHKATFDEANPEHTSKYSAWETPYPVAWTGASYAVVRADERGLGQSPGYLGTMIQGTSECFSDVVEWCAEQPWSTGQGRHGGIYSKRFIEIWGTFQEDDLAANLRDQARDNEANRFRGDDYYRGYTHAGSKFKYLRFIAGRYDLPFYYRDEVEAEKSFLDAFLKDQDTVGWSVPESYYLNADQSLAMTKLPSEPTKLSYKALGRIHQPELISFTTPPFEEETEVTGHIVAHLNFSIAPENPANESDIDPSSTPALAGDLVPLCKGWLRVSTGKVHTKDPKHRPWVPHREYLSTDVLLVRAGEIYGADVELWPTNAVVDQRGWIVFEVSSGDTQGCWIIQHVSDIDR
ncbi:Alpha/Beta hydrolase protein [Phialemonium atrogriseum]|uniref:Alpha/Beta hydrolase protein n=1 Tax=Phialemonium atrogriseum TaxID=1093897 RepID=A0AAJ0C882_9PEZI|nr:Alpha/Beta hydrolase protein [Phialemonium atrogriseum]KAK1770527.1 Alpha/Beta hydrolase protein [Phialemonium atrogriseum]